MQRSRVRIGANYMTLVVNAMCLDGMAQALAPGYNVLDAAAPLLKAWSFAETTPPKVRKGIEAVLFPLAARVKRARDRAGWGMKYLRSPEKRSVACSARASFASDANTTNT